MTIDLASLVAGKNLILAGSSFALTSMTRRALKDFFEGRLGKRLLPLLPVLFGIIGALGGVCDGVETWPERVALGSLLGFLSGHLFKLGKTTVMGIGLPPKKDQLPSAEGGDDAESADQS